jgi:crotonobetainyl-CoA:carnitine CoA-transferase CaiB-like acyl-CoA transferase
VALLQGYTCLDLTDHQGQFTGRILADLGMRVIKVEPPCGDPVRRLGPFQDDVADPDRSLPFAFLNGGKESVTLDIATADGRQMLLGLVEHADVLLESFPPGHLDALGLGPEMLQEHRPTLVVSSLSPFGQDGPRASYQATDMVAVAMGGLMFISGDPGLTPVRPPETQAYYYGSVFAAYGVLLALYQRGEDGPAQRLDVSMQESIATQEHMIREAAFDGVEITRNGSQHKHTAPANIFPCRDGHVYLFILSARDWDRLLDLWSDHPAELDAPELKPPANRRRHIELINPLVEAFTRRYTKSELTTLLQTHGIPCLPVNSPTDFLAEDQVTARDFIGTVSSPAMGEYRTPRFPALFDGTRPDPAGPPPALGQDNGRLYGEWLGIDAGELRLLAARGVV